MGSPNAWRGPVLPGHDRTRATHAALLASGIVAPLLYVATDVLLALRWAGYSYRDQTISELNAIGAPTRQLSIVLGLVGYTLLIAFGVGVKERISVYAYQLWLVVLAFTLLRVQPEG